MKRENFEIGCRGETIAKRYLQNKGYIIIEQNYKNKYAEIDLIACDKKVLVFIEVRTKIGEIFGTPEDSLNRNKIKKLIRNAAAYAAQKGYIKDYRIDAVCIVLDEKKNIERINHYQNISF
jgi:putative endonuclease